MSNDFHIGDHVRLLQLPEWLLHDLPANEQVELRSYVGQIAVVQEIDRFGHVWIGFGATKEHEGGAYFAGHSFGVPTECLDAA